MASESSNIYRSSHVPHQLVGTSKFAQSIVDEDVPHFTEQLQEIIERSSDAAFDPRIATAHRHQYDSIQNLSMVEQQ